MRLEEDKGQNDLITRKGLLRSVTAHIRRLLMDQAAGRFGCENEREEVTRASDIIVKRQ